MKRYPVGSEITGAVASVVEFGAFVKLDAGVEGLIYSNDLSSEPVSKPGDVVSVGQEVRAVVTRVDPVDQKISLSIRALTDRELREELKRHVQRQSTSQTTTFGDLLKEKLAKKEAGE
jgi:ribosomal protein S1